MKVMKAQAEIESFSVTEWLQNLLLRRNFLVKNIEAYMRNCDV